MKVITSPERADSIGRTVFLAGSIEMGTAVDWQQQVIQELQNEPVTLFNPRREDWDSSWVQSISNPQFNEQVTWELDHLIGADIAFFYFDAGTKSPITLMELGMVLGLDSLSERTARPIVVCPEGFWRRGNVEIMCDRWHYQVYDTLEQGLEALMKEIK